MSQLVHIICANWHILTCDLSLQSAITENYQFSNYYENKVILQRKKSH